MYYSNGNYEAFARPKKPEGMDSKNAYIIGTGLAALTAACYLVRDAQMPGSHIHVFEKDAVPGGACDGANIPGVGYVMRGGRGNGRTISQCDVGHVAVPFHPSKRKAFPYLTSITG